LIQLPVLLHHNPRRSANDRNEEYRAPWDTEANSSFISTKRVKLGLEIDAVSAAVKSGDGSKQLSPGTVQVTFSIGSRFKTTAQLRVINLDIFDVIIGMDLFLRHKFTFEYDPFQISAVCP
jgi:hypothetical protein